MDNTKFLKIVIVLLLLINIGTIAFLWMHRPQHEDGSHAQFDMVSYLSHELNFTDAQQQLAKQLIEENRNSRVSLREKNKELHDQFFDLLGSASADADTVKSMADSIASIQCKLELLTFYHFQKMRGICNEEQKKKFDLVIKDALRMMAPKPQGK